MDPRPPAAGCPVVSVIIIFLNAQKYLREAVDSVLAQTFTDWELLLVDDGSTDASTALARGLAAEQPGRIIYLEHEGHQNRGMSASRNLGLAHARGQFVAPLDSDDIWFPEKLTTQVAILAKHPDVAMVAAPAMNWYADGARQIQTMTLPEGVMPAGAWIPKILEKDDNTSGPSSVMIRTSVLKSVGGFEESFRGPLMFFEDQVTWFKVTLVSPIYFHPAPLILYRIHEDSCCVSTPTDQQIAARIVLYARLLEFIADSRGPARKRGMLLAMARSRAGELRLRSAAGQRKEAARLDTTGAVQRQALGVPFTAVALLGAVSKGTATTLFGKAFTLLSVIYHEGTLSGARTVPGILRRATRKLAPRSLQG